MSVIQIESQKIIFKHNKLVILEIQLKSNFQLNLTDMNKLIKDLLRYFKTF